MTEIAYTREQIGTAITTMSSQLEQATSDTGMAHAVTSVATALLDRTGPGPFTYDQVSEALNQAANALDDTVDYESSETIREQDIRNLAVNVTMHQLQYPGTSLSDAIEDKYGTDPVEVLEWVA